jgi:hypothetical protein
MPALQEEIQPKTNRWTLLLGGLQTGGLPVANGTVRNLIEIEDWTGFSSFLTLSPVLEWWQNVLPPVTSGSCPCSLPDRFPLRLRYSVRGRSVELRRFYADDEIVIQRLVLANVLV